MDSGDICASVSVLGALFSRSASGLALDITFLWQLAQLLLKIGCAAIRAPGPAIGKGGRWPSSGVWARRHVTRRHETKIRIYTTERRSIGVIILTIPAARPAIEQM